MGIQDSRWFQIVNGWTGVTAIVVSLIVFLILIVIYIIRIRREPLKVFSFFTDDYRSTPTKILRVVVFLLLTVGFVAVIYYNINKMANADPVLSTNVGNNTFTPSIAFCPPYVALKVVSATYTDINGVVQIDLTDALVDIPSSADNSTPVCKLFNETLFTRPKQYIGGTYDFTFISSINFIDITIGDINFLVTTNNATQLDIHSDIGEQFVTSDSFLKYAETRYVDLNGGTHRSFTLTTTGDIPTDIVNATTQMGINIIAPISVITNTENPALDLATFFGNFGGYLTICGLFGFLFGSGKMSPFGFVTDYCFPDKDKSSLMKNLGTDSNNSNDNNDLEKSTPEAGPNRIITEYYVDMELFSK